VNTSRPLPAETRDRFQYAELLALERKPMTMHDWITNLDEFLKASGRRLLDHAGSVSAEDAKTKAEQEYARYHALLDAQPRAIDAAFEKVAKQLKKLTTPRGEEGEETVSVTMRLSAGDRCRRSWGRDTDGPPSPMPARRSKKNSNPRRPHITVARLGRRQCKVLARLTSDESARVLRALLERHPGLVAEAEELAAATVTDVDAQVVADDVEQAVLSLDIDQLNTRAGRTRWGYVEPTDAAWELLGETIEPFLAQMTRHIELAFEAAAIAQCAGIVLGLHRCRGKNSDELLGWAEDFLRKRPVMRLQRWRATAPRSTAARGDYPRPSSIRFRIGRR
jgi:hypothetical protein